MDDPVPGPALPFPWVNYKFAAAAALLSPLTNESQNPLFWEKGGRTDLAEMTLDQLSASLPRPRPSTGREILLLVWLQQLPPGAQKATPPVLPSFGLNRRE